MKKLLIVLLLIIVTVFLGQKFFNLNPLPKKGITQTNPQPIIKTGQVITTTVSRPVIGIHYRVIDEQMAVQNNIVEGFYITQVIGGSPAEKAGLQEEDIITEIDGNQITSDNSQFLTDLIAGKTSGETVNLKVWKNNEVKDIIITLDIN